MGRKTEIFKTFPNFRNLPSLPSPGTLEIKEGGYARLGKSQRVCVHERQSPTIPDAPNASIKIALAFSMDLARKLENSKIRREMRGPIAGTIRRNSMVDKVIVGRMVLMVDLLDCIRGSQYK